ncbi:Chaperone protein TorD, partial [Clarias magur]
ICVCIQCVSCWLCILFFSEASERSLLLSHESELLSLSFSLVELLPKEEASSSLMSCLVSSQ